MDMEKKWFYVVRGDRKGPVSFEELRQLFRNGALSQADLVWQPDFGAEWKKIRDVPALMDPAVPPLVNRSTATLSTAPVITPEMRRSLGETRGDDIPPDPRADDTVPLTGEPGETPRAMQALTLAWERMLAILFREISFVRWFGIGFCAWLATVGSGGHIRVFDSAMRDASRGAGRGMDKWLETLDTKLFSHESIAMGICFALTFFAVYAFLTWLRSRGDFMIVHRWYHPDAPLNETWAISPRLGRSVWLWRLSVSICTWLLAIPFFLTFWVQVIRPLLKAGWSGPSALAMLPSIVGWGSVLVLITLVYEMLDELLVDFVIPVMYCQQVSVCSAWRSAFSLCNQHPIGIIGFYLLKLGLRILSGIAVILFIMGTLLIGAFLLAIPYLNAVILLPVTLLFRGYSLYYLSLWRPELVKEA